MIQVKEKDSYGEYGINYEMCMSLGEAKKRYYEVFKEENEKMKKTYELNDGKNNHFDKFENALNGATLVFVKETIFESGL